MTVSGASRRLGSQFAQWLARNTPYWRTNYRFAFAAFMASRNCWHGGHR